LVIHPDKSVTSPSQEVIILGFVINSITMTIRVTNAKKERIKTFLIAAIENPIDISIRQVAKIIGYLVSTLPGVQYGALYYRYLEMDKVSALKISKGNFDAPMTISKDGLVELRWWVNHIDESFNYLMIPPIDITIYSDASLQGWGAVLGDTSSGGRWSPDECTNHINYLELLAAFFALKSFCTTIQGKHVKLMIDNTTAVAVINNMGSCHSRACHSVGCQIWQFCVEYNIWLTAAHIPGAKNVLADKKSRHFQSQTLKQCREENNSGACPGNFSCPRLAHPALVSTVGPASCSTSSGSGTQSHTADPLSLSENNSSPLQKAETFSMSCLRQQLLRGYSLRSIEIIESSWRDSTKSQYQVHLQKWLQFCMERDCDFISPNLPQALDFLSSLFDSALSYSSLNS
ncbi:Transposon Tf2-6 poly, partial [Paramuricea clavata]